ncbi:Panacea domain-containing protein [Sinomonas sp. P47F7]|uniref:Panacea domain-containing protein n=1 Tax=Sinomonas sp. P47F7 TaxID=3410987 RepID=UPI003BF4AD60
MSLQKLLYYVQAWHLAITDTPLFSERIKAWKDGPVVPDVWHKRQDQASRRPAVQELDGVELDELASDLIDLVLAAYGSMSGEELSALTHVEQPWNEAREGVPEGANSQNPIDPATMATFYRAHRMLAGRSAADLAAGGIHLHSHEVVGPVDVDALLAELGGPEFDPGDDPWGGGNLHDSTRYAGKGIEHGCRRTYAGA